MTVYRFSSRVTVSAITEVEADTLEDARDMAAQRQVALAGYGDMADECWIIEEADGEAEDITLVEEDEA